MIARVFDEELSTPNYERKDMDSYLDLSNHELGLIGNGLYIMLQAKTESSKHSAESEIKKDHENIKLELFELWLKVKSLKSKYIDLSINELKLIKGSLILLAKFSYKTSLKQKDKTDYYENYNLQLIEVSRKINNIELYKMSWA